MDIKMDIIEPNADLPWEIYLDWLGDQGHDELRYVDAASLCYGGSEQSHCHYIFKNNSVAFCPDTILEGGAGEAERFSMIELIRERYCKVRGDSFTTGNSGRGCGI